jgi:outer membrane protein TolC
MLRIKYAVLAVGSLLMVVLNAPPAPAQFKSSSKYGTGGVQAPSVSGQAPPAAIPPGEMAVPQVNVPARDAEQFERNPVLSIPGVFAHQWSPADEIAPEGLISERYLKTLDNTARKLTLKQAIYIAIRNNPGLAVVALDPVASTESVKLANAAFDPDLTSQLDLQKTVNPVTSVFQVRNSRAFTQKFYDWNFAVSKVSATTNGTFSVAFDNDRSYSNSSFSSPNPFYTPTVQLSLVQPLLRNFGWDFATINVRLSESAQRASQWNYGSALNDFVQTVANDYWALVAAEENLQVALSALQFNNDLVRVNRISVQVGTLAPIDLQEAQSAAATAQANVYAAEAAVQTARAALRQAVILNPASTFVPEEIEPADVPNPAMEIKDTEEVALEKMVLYSPALAGLRESIRSALLQVKFSENQVLPQLNLGTQFGLTSARGRVNCTQLVGTTTGSNCTTTSGTPGATIPSFKGGYDSALNRLFDFGYYNYAAVISFEMPLDNAAAKAALAQSRVSYEQSRLQYRSALSQSVAEIETALANLHADVQRVQATKYATYYAAQSLHDEQVRFRVGMATTHDLLQFQSELVTAQGNEVTADVDLENARIYLWWAEGVLLNYYNIDFQLQDPHESPWYSKF